MENTGFQYPQEIKQYKFMHELGKGSNGRVAGYYHKDTLQKVAIKFEDKKIMGHQFLSEQLIMKKMGGVNEVPKYIDHGICKDTEVNYIIMEIIPHPIDNLFVDEATEKSRYIQEMITCVQKLHEVGIIHREIKPQAFRMTDKNFLKIMGFSISKEYLDDKTKEHMKPVGGRGTKGSPAYCSRYSHEGLEMSRRDDLESLGYSILGLLNYTLPWMDLQQEEQINERSDLMSQFKKQSDYLKRIGEEKFNFLDRLDQFKTEVSENENKQLLLGTFEFLNYVKDLGFDETPDYDKLRQFYDQQPQTQNNQIIEQEVHIESQYQIMTDEGQNQSENESPGLNINDYMLVVVNKHHFDMNLTKEYCEKYNLELDDDLRQKISQSLDNKLISQKLSVITQNQQNNVRYQLDGDQLIKLTDILTKAQIDTVLNGRNEDIQEILISKSKFDKNFEKLKEIIEKRENIDQELRRINQEKLKMEEEIKNLDRQYLLGIKDLIEINDKTMRLTDLKYFDLELDFTEEYDCINYGDDIYVSSDSNYWSQFDKSQKMKFDSTTNKWSFRFYQIYQQNPQVLFKFMKKQEFERYSCFFGSKKLPLQSFSPYNNYIVFEQRQ